MSLWNPIFRESQRKQRARQRCGRLLYQPKLDACSECGGDLRKLAEDVSEVLEYVDFFGHLSICFQDVAELNTSGLKNHQRMHFREETLAHRLGLERTLSMPTEELQFGNTTYGRIWAHARIAAAQRRRRKVKACQRFGRRK